MSQLKNKTTLNLILFFCIFVLGSAYFIEYILGHKPCNLCLIERLPYIFSIIVILLGLILKKFEKFIFILLALIFISATIISFYHFGIEQGFFNESLACTTNGLSENITKEELLKQLSQNSISCKDVSFKIFGFSLASINAIFSLILTVIFAKLFLKYGKN